MKAEENNKLDNAFKHKLENAEATPANDIWARLNAGLDEAMPVMQAAAAPAEAKVRPLIWWHYSAAACLALAAFATVFMLNRNGATTGQVAMNTATRGENKLSPKAADQQKQGATTGKAAKAVSPAPVEAAEEELSPVQQAKDNHKAIQKMVSPKSQLARVTQTQQYVAVATTKTTTATKTTRETKATNEPNLMDKHQQEIMELSKNNKLNTNLAQVPPIQQEEVEVEIKTANDVFQVSNNGTAPQPTRLKRIVNGLKLIKSGNYAAVGQNVNLASFKDSE